MINRLLIYVRYLSEKHLIENAQTMGEIFRCNRLTYEFTDEKYTAIVVQITGHIYLDKRRSPKTKYVVETLIPNLKTLRSTPEAFNIRANLERNKLKRITEKSMQDRKKISTQKRI